MKEFYVLASDKTTGATYTTLLKRVVKDFYSQPADVISRTSIEEACTHLKEDLKHDFALALIDIDLTESDRKELLIIKRLPEPLLHPNIFTCLPYIRALKDKLPKCKVVVITPYEKRYLHGFLIEQTGATTTLDKHSVIPSTIRLLLEAT